MPLADADFHAVVVTRYTRGLALAAAIAAVACSVAGGAATPRFSNQGQRLPLNAAVRAAMIRAHRSPDIYRIATLGRLTFFRFGNHRSRFCYGVKRDFALSEVTAASVPRVFGGYECWSRLSPVMDFSIVGASRQHPAMSIFRLEGLAADDIRAIQLLSKSGRVLASVPVRHNVYALWSVPSGAVSLRGVTRAGKLLPRIP